MFNIIIIFYKLYVFLFSDNVKIFQYHNVTYHIVLDIVKLEILASRISKSVMNARKNRIQVYNQLRVRRVSEPGRRVV